MNSPLAESWANLRKSIPPVKVELVSGDGSCVSSVSDSVWRLAARWGYIDSGCGRWFDRLSPPL
jgi:hypothetical protein